MCPIIKVSSANKWWYNGKTTLRCNLSIPRRKFIYFSFKFFKKYPRPAKERPLIFISKSIHKLLYFNNLSTSSVIVDNCGYLLIFPKMVTFWVTLFNFKSLGRVEKIPLLVGSFYHLPSPSLTTIIISPLSLVTIIQILIETS